VPDTTSRDTGGPLADTRTARAFLFRGLSLIRRVLPRPVAVCVAVALADLAYLVLHVRRRTVLTTLSLTAAGRSQAEQRRLCRATFRNFATCLVDVLNLPHATGPEMVALVEYDGVDPLHRALDHGRGVILVSAHVGNWDLGGAGLAALGLQVSAVAEQLGPSLDRVHAAIRGATGLRTLPLGRAGIMARRALQHNEIVTPGLAVPFSRGIRSVPIGPAALALAARAPIVSAYIVLAPQPALRPYLGVVEPLVDVSELAGLGVEELTLRIAQRLTAIVERYPDQWFVFQPDWTTGPVPGTPTSVQSTSHA
jgi:KDO2-lipid IV(A) lauroyltransferase